MVQHVQLYDQLSLLFHERLHRINHKELHLVGSPIWHSFLLKYGIRWWNDVVLVRGEQHTCRISVLRPEY